MIVEKLIDEIIAKRKQRLCSSIQRYPRKNPILSDIGDCDRAIEYGITNWQDKAMFDEYVQARLEVGREEERRVSRELMELGYDLILSQQPVEVKGREGEILATGKIDGFIRYENTKIPIEIKSMNPQIFNQITCVEDLNKKPWLRKYTRQLQMYMFGNNCEEGFFLITDCLGHWKMLPVYLSYEDCEWILQRLERIHKNLANGEFSDRIPYEEKICGMCPFVQVCLPDVVHSGMEVIDEKEFESKLSRRDELKPLAKEFEEIDEQIKEKAKAFGKDLLVGNFSVFLRRGQRTTYNIPDEVKKPFSEKVETLTVKIIKNK